MKRSGCNRMCTVCNKTIYDLEQYTFAETDALLRKGKNLCVRAQLNANGTIKLKSEGSSSVRRVVASVGLSLGLLAMGTEASAKKSEIVGTIVGTVDMPPWPSSVIAVAGDGSRHHGKIKPNGHYKIKNLLPGTYTLEFTSACGAPDKWKSAPVIVQEQGITVSNTTDPNGCIVVGMIVVETNDG